LPRSHTHALQRRAHTTRTHRALHFAALSTSGINALALHHYTKAVAHYSCSSTADSTGGLAVAHPTPFPHPHTPCPHPTPHHTHTPHFHTHTLPLPPPCTPPPGRLHPTHCPTPPHPSAPRLALCLSSHLHPTPPPGTLPATYWLARRKGQRTRVKKSSAAQRRQISSCATRQPTLSLSATGYLAFCDSNARAFACNATLSAHLLLAPLPQSWTRDINIFLAACGRPRIAWQAQRALGSAPAMIVADHRSTAARFLGTLALASAGSQAAAFGLLQALHPVSPAAHPPHPHTHTPTRPLARPTPTHAPHTSPPHCTTAWLPHASGSDTPSLAETARITRFRHFLIIQTRRFLCWRTAAHGARANIAPFGFTAWKNSWLRSFCLFTAPRRDSAQ